MDLLTIRDEYEVTFNELYDKCESSQARQVLDEIIDADLEEDFMGWLFEVFNASSETPPSFDEVEDYIRFDWQDIYRNIGLLI